MRIGPGGGGSSTRPRVYVSKSRNDPPQGLVLRQGDEQRRELRPSVAAGESQPQRLQVAADRLQLPDELPGSVVIEPVARSLAQLLEPLERRRRVGGELRLLGLQHLDGELPRLVQVASA